MPKFSFTKLVDIDRDKFFAISTDYERFTEILPEYFLELKIVEREGNTTKIFETLRFLGKTVNVTTEHVIEKPDRHIVKMLDGQAKGTIFDEKYGEWLGCHMIGDGVTDMIAEAVLGRKLETTGKEILKAVHPHPTMSEALMESVADAYDEVIHL